MVLAPKGISCWWKLSLYWPRSCFHPADQCAGQDWLQAVSSRSHHCRGFLCWLISCPRAVLQTWWTWLWDNRHTFVQINRESSYDRLCEGQFGLDHFWCSGRQVLPACMKTSICCGWRPKTHSGMLEKAAGWWLVPIFSRHCKHRTPGGVSSSSVLGVAVKLRVIHLFAFTAMLNNARHYEDAMRSITTWSTISHFRSPVYPPASCHGGIYPGWAKWQRSQMGAFKEDCH